MNENKKKLIAELEQIKNLPTLPEVVLKLQSALSDDRTNVRALGALLREDQSLSTTVLKVANSAYYGAGGNTSSIEAAVMRLGFSEIKKMTTAVSLVKTFNGYGKGLDHKSFWIHCFTVGITTQILYKRIGLPIEPGTDAAYSAGLLHDVGFMILDQYFPKFLEEVNTLTAKEKIPIWEAETQVMGMDHGQIGGLLLQRWGLPESLVNAVTFHHDPDLCDPRHRHLTQLIHLAEFTCLNQGVGYSGEGSSEHFKESAWHELGIKIDDVPDILEEVQDEADKSEVLASLAGSWPADSTQM